MEKEKQVIQIILTSGAVKEYTRNELIKLIQDRVSAGHADDIADLITFQIKMREYVDYNLMGKYYENQDIYDGEDI